MYIYINIYVGIYIFTYIHIHLWQLPEDRDSRYVGSDELEYACDAHGEQE